MYIVFIFVLQIQSLQRPINKEDGTAVSFQLNFMSE